MAKIPIESASTQTGAGPACAWRVRCQPKGGKVATLALPNSEVSVCASVIERSLLLFIYLRWESWNPSLLVLRSLRLIALFADKNPVDKKLKNSGVRYRL